MSASWINPPFLLGPHFWNLESHLYELSSHLASKMPDHFVPLPMASISLVPRTLSVMLLQVQHGTFSPWCLGTSFRLAFQRPHMYAGFPSGPSTWLLIIKQNFIIFVCHLNNNLWYLMPYNKSSIALHTVFFLLLSCSKVQYILLLSHSHNTK